MPPSERHSGDLSQLATVTSTTLLDGLLDPANRTVWNQYVDRYRPLVVRFCGRVGLEANDAEDVAQTSLLDFSQAYTAGSYDRERGRLREWLYGIVRNRIKNFRRRRKDREVQVGADADGPFAELAAREDFEELWEEEWRDAVIRQCLHEVRREVEEQTYRAFELFAVEERPANQVAQELGITPNAVYGAKRRIMERLKELRPMIEEAF